MPVFIELTTDAFEEVLATQSRSKQGGGGRSGRAGRQIARRPTRGLEIKEDTYAILKLVRADGVELPLIDSSSPDGLTTSGYANFLLQNVAEARMEKHQIVETFGSSYIFFFGESPRFLDVSAVLINSHDFNWEAEWWENYNRYLRGTKSVELGARTYLFYDDNVVEGYILLAQATKSADQPLLINLQFKLFVTNYTNISFIGDPNFPVRASVALPDGVDLTRGDAQEALITHYRNEALDQAELENFDQKGIIAKKLQEGGFAPGKKISELFRSAPPTFAVAPDWWTAIERLTPLQGQQEILQLLTRSGKPLRGLIAENTDEFVGGGDGRTNFGFETGELRPPSALAPTILDAQEVDDLFRESIQFLSCFGADMNNADHIIKIGLGPKFGSSANDGATFKPIAGAPFGFGVTDTEGLPSKEQFKQFKQDPLGSVFGKPKGSLFGNDFGQQSKGEFGSKYTQGAADPLYGYPSDFANKPGFGQVGFGDFGGLGFGSGNSEGDPGFKDPEKFTFAGVSDNRGAFNRFLKPKEDPTSFSLGANLSAGTSGLSGGAATAINGKPSPFGMIVVDGILDPTGQARSAAEAISEKQQQQKFGFSVDNPFGVECPDPATLSLQLSFP